MTTERDQLELRYHALAELERRRREAPCLFYRTLIERHPKQKAFHDAGTKFRTRILSGGNRCGKTTSGRAEAVAHVYGYRFWEVPNLKLTPDGDLPPRDEIPTKYWIRRLDGIPIRVPNVGMVLSGLPRLRGIGQNIFPGIMEFLPAALRTEGRGGCRVLRGAQGVADWMEFPNGSKIIFASAEQDPMTFEGFQLDWAWPDEPPRQAVYRALWARLFDYTGPMWLTMTPIKASCAWMHGLLLDPPADVFVQQVSIYDNPANTKEMIDDFIKNGDFSEAELKARLSGEPEFLGGRLLENFDARVHVIPGFEPPADWIHLLSVDPHTKRPAACLWIAFDTRTRIYHFYRERPGGGNFHTLRGGALPPADLANLIRAAEGARPIRLRCCDPRFSKAEFTIHGVKQTSFVEEMAKCGMYFDANVPNTGSIDYGVQVLNGLLRYDRSAPIAPDNTPHLFIHDTCENTINSFQRLGFLDEDDPTRGGQKKLDESFKDFFDCARYGVLYPLPATPDQIESLQRISPEALERENNGDL